jgi:hypothetical protein
MIRRPIGNEEELWEVIREEGLLKEPPVFAPAEVRGPVAVAWWGLRIYVLLMATLVLVGFFHGLR